MTTRDKILNETLTLFSENGFDGTSVEQIAEKVGIKAPSLYNHFKGKEDILNALIDTAEARYEESFGSEKHFGKLPHSRDEFIAIALKKVEFTVFDPIIGKIRKFLVREQFRSERFAEITTRHQVGGVQKMYAKIIEDMMNEGLFKQDDPSLLAMELTSPVVVMIAKADRQPQYRQKIMQDIEKHLRHFCAVYMMG